MQLLAPHGGCVTEGMRRRRWDEEDEQSDNLQLPAAQTGQGLGEQQLQDHRLQQQTVLMGRDTPTPSSCCIPDKLISVNESRVVVPTAVSRLID